MGCCYGPPGRPCCPCFGPGPCCPGCCRSTAAPVVLGTKSLETVNLGTVELGKQNLGIVDSGTAGAFTGAATGLDLGSAGAGAGAFTSNIGVDFGAAGQSSYPFQAGSAGMTTTTTTPTTTSQYGIGYATSSIIGVTQEAVDVTYSTKGISGDFSYFVM